MAPGANYPFPPPRLRLAIPAVVMRPAGYRPHSPQYNPIALSSEGPQ